MQKYFDNVISSNGTPLSGASIQVNVSGGSAATLYSDNGITTRSNPVLTDSLGYFDFYVANGNYDLIVTKAGYPSVTRSDVTIGGSSDSTNIAQSVTIASAVDSGINFANGRWVTLTGTISADVVIPSFNNMPLGQSQIKWPYTQDFNIVMPSGLTIATEQQYTLLNYDGTDITQAK